MKMFLQDFLEMVGILIVGTKQEDEMVDLGIELRKLGVKVPDWEKLPLYGVRFRCEICRFGRSNGLWFSCLRDRKDYPGGHVCDEWEGKMATKKENLEKG